MSASACRAKQCTVGFDGSGARVGVTMVPARRRLYAVLALVAVVALLALASVMGYEMDAGVQGLVKQ